MSAQIQQASVKLFLQDSQDLDLDAFIPIFHEWIRAKRLPDHLLIDVADYRHVPDGPGVMLVAHEAHYGIDSEAGKPGFLYSRKRDPIGDAGTAMKDALKRAAMASELVEQEESLGGKLKFRTSDLELRVVSRLTAPNTEETRKALEPVWTAVLEEAGFSGLELETASDPRSPFTLRIRSCATSPDLANLAASL